MKKNWTMKMGTTLLVLTLLSTCLLSGTFAKYTTTVTGESTATVAKWGWEINDAALDSGSGTYTFDLFKTVKEADGTNAETSVATNKIAPGTGGIFDLKIDNISDVDATYAIDFALTNTDSIPLEFSADGATWGMISAINVGETAIAKTDGTATVKVHWRWAFDGNDNVDTGIGVKDAATAKVTATATFTQAD